MSECLFVTGGTGLVGSHVVEEAIARGFRVRAPVRASSDTRWLDRWKAEKIVGDLEDRQALRTGVQGADRIVNCAAKVGDWGTLAEFRRLNVEALRLLIDAGVEANVKRFVHVSSLGVYEARDHFGTDETVPPAADSLDAYTRSKTEAEALVMEAIKTRGLPATIVRPGFIYGPRDRTVLPKLIKVLRSGRFAYFGSGEQAMNCVYVKNLVYGIFLALEKPEAVGEIFNLTDGARVTKRQFIGRVAELAGLRPPKRAIPLGLARTSGNRPRNRRPLARRDRTPFGQQGALQISRPQPRLLNRQSPSRSRLSTPIRHRTRSRRRLGRPHAERQGALIRNRPEYPDDGEPGDARCKHSKCNNRAFKVQDSKNRCRQQRSRHEFLHFECSNLVSRVFVKQDHSTRFGMKSSLHRQCAAR